MNIVRRKYVGPACAALIALGFTNTPSLPAVPASSTWEAIDAEMQGPQGSGPQAPGKKAEDDSTVLFGSDDLAQTNWPGLSTVGGLVGLSGSPLNTPSTANAAAGPGGRPPLPATPLYPHGRLLPPAPVAPLSIFLP